jgi:hypothetical protein
MLLLMILSQLYMINPKKFIFQLLLMCKKLKEIQVIQLKYGLT